MLEHSSVGKNAMTRTVISFQMLSDKELPPMTNAEKVFMAGGYPRFPLLLLFLLLQSAITTPLLMTEASLIHAAATTMLLPRRSRQKGAQ